MSLCSVKVDTPIPSAKCSKVSMIDILKSWKRFYVEGHLLLERGLISFQNEKIEEPSKLNVDISKSSNFSLVVS